MQKTKEPSSEASPRAPHATMSRRDLLAMFTGGALCSLNAGCSREPAASAAGSSLHFLSLTDVARLVETGEVGPVELTQLMLDRINTVDPRFKSYATVMTEQANASAQPAEAEIRAGSYRGPLHGIPVAVKDLCYTNGVRTMGGSGALADFVPAFDATVVSRLNEAGAVLLGKLNLTEGAMLGYHTDFDLPVNPWGEDLWAGASSSGSGVATAAGLCFASLGSDTGGSIRYPSMANGIVGLKPTYGRVSRYGVLPLAESLDHVGPMTRTVEDAAIVLEAIAGFDPNDPTSLRAPVPDMRTALRQGVEGIRIGYDRSYGTDGVDARLAAAIDVALGVLADLGAEIVEVEVPGVTGSIRDVWVTICSYEAVRAHASTYPSRAADYGPYFRDFLEIGSAVTDGEYAEASSLRDIFSDRFRSVLSTVDAVACPSGGVPFSAPADVHYGGREEWGPLLPNLQAQFTMPADFAGTPTISLPCGENERGVPYTIQFMGEALSEPTLCRLANGYEEATDWHTMRPSV